MKYNTFSNSRMPVQGQNSALSICTGPEYFRDKMGCSTDMAFIRCELEMTKKALKIQSRRCRQLIAEFTRKLQAKELQVITERQIRDEQLAKLVRSLLFLEARLRQEQTYIRHELKERDELILRQKKTLGRLWNTVQYCPTCSQYWDNICDTSSEYHHELWESGSEFCASVSESGLLPAENHSSGEDTQKSEHIYEKCNQFNKMKDKKRCKRIKDQRRPTGTYFEVLNSRTDLVEHDTNSDDHIEAKNDESDPEISATTDNVTNEEKEQQESDANKIKLISNTIPVFDDEADRNNDWYASGSDQEENDHTDIYKNNPVLECMNQILLQNINDSINSPPESPEFDRNTKINKTNKRVKFDEENHKDKPSIETIAVPIINENNLTPNKEQTDYYETPIQANTNVYEIPQSIYSNDYEQILSKSGDSVKNCSFKTSSPSLKIEHLQENQVNRMPGQKLTLAKCNDLDSIENKSDYYIDMETEVVTLPQEIKKKTKVARTPPALPPKPSNLVSKFKLQSLRNNQTIDESCSVDSEPDYCSISELNMPSSDQKNSPTYNKIHNVSLYDPISLDGTLSSLVAKNLEKNSSPIKNEKGISNIANITPINLLKTKHEPEIPKLPQVSEIIIPDEIDVSKKMEHISQDNYIKNNSQLFKQKHDNYHAQRNIFGTSVSHLISTFNNQYNLSQIRHNKSLSNFDYSQSFEKRPQEKPRTEVATFDKFELSQNFEEFNLDDCEIGEEYLPEDSNSLTSLDDNNMSLRTNSISPSTKVTTSQSNLYDDNSKILENELKNITEEKPNITPAKVGHNLKASLQQLQKELAVQKTSSVPQKIEPSYEHFLECTGLSSKSILTPARALSNHKNILKLKDIKLRSKYKSAAILEHSGNTVKYWSEPYL